MTLCAPGQRSAASASRRHFPAAAPLFADVLAGHERWRATQAALVCGDARLTWGELGARSNRVAHALLETGLGPGDAVAVLMDNRVDTVVVLLGLLKAGCCAVPLNLTLTAAAIAGMIVDAGARCVIATEADAARLDGLLEDHGLINVVVGEHPSWQRFAAWTEGRSEAPPEVAIGDDDPCHIIYSSGTTGTPKGIVHTHRGRYDWACDVALALRYHGAARTLASLPLYSNISWVMLLSTFLCGGTLVLMERFDAATALEVVQAERISHLAMVPVQFQRLIDHAAFATTDTASLEAMMSCGAALPRPLKDRLFSAFPCGVIELYGLTEGVITILDPERAAGRLESVGRPLPGTEIEIVDELGRLQPRGEVGEIVARGRFMMLGYHGRADANGAATWRDPRGRIWLRTGDLGRIDDGGFLSIVGRRKDMIVSGGQNIYPSDIEAVLLEHPEVEAAAVIGVPSRTWGETPLAVIEPERSAAACDAVRTWANARLGRFQRVAEVVSVSSLPRNANGKILKRELEQSFGGEERE